MKDNQYNIVYKIEIEAEPKGALPFPSEFKTLALLHKDAYRGVIKNGKELEKKKYNASKIAEQVIEKSIDALQNRGYKEPSFTDSLAHRSYYSLTDRLLQRKNCADYFNISGITDYWGYAIIEYGLLGDSHDKDFKGTVEELIPRILKEEGLSFNIIKAPGEIK